MPLYLNLLGGELFGIFGFFMLLQSWFVILDAGLTPTFSRQVAFIKGKNLEMPGIKQLTRNFEIIFIVTAVLIFFVIFSLNNFLSSNWIKAEETSQDVISAAIFVMGLMVPLRWITGLYRSGIIGFEDQVWVNKASMIFISLRMMGGLLLLFYVEKNIIFLLLIHLFVFAIELFIFAIRFYSRMPKNQLKASASIFKWSSFINLIPFSLSIGYTTILWVMVSQFDKLILSGILNLDHFGYFSLLVMIANGVMLMSAPVSAAILPRMTNFVANEKETDLKNLYATSSQFVALLISCLAATLILFGEEILFIWTRNEDATIWISSVMPLFILSSAVLSLAAFSYYLQTAYGSLKLHVLGETISAILFLPTIYFAAINYGVMGVGCATLIFRLIWFLVWTPIVHKKFLKGFHLSWLFKRIIPTSFFAIIISVLLKTTLFNEIYENTFLALMQLISFGILSLILTALFISDFRKYTINFVSNLFKKIT